MIVTTKQKYGYLWYSKEKALTRNVLMLQKGLQKKSHVINSGLKINVCKINFLFLKHIIYVVDTPMNRLNDTVLLSTQNKC